MSSDMEHQQAYFAAELFHLPSRLFNDALVKGLESKGIQIFSPQRDGFEFVQLASVLTKHLPPEEIEKALNNLIYTYDILSIWESDLVIARFDEPPDPGVDTEVLFANTANIPVIAYRTDDRSPYGNARDKYGGMHSFPIKGSQVLIIQPSSSSPDKDLQELTEKIFFEANTLLANAPQKKIEELPRNFQNTLGLAHILFGGFNVHTEEGVAALAAKYLKHHEAVDNFGPRVVR